MDMQAYIFIFTVSVLYNGINIFLVNKAQILGYLNNEQKNEEVNCFLDKL